MSETYKGASISGPVVTTNWSPSTGYTSTWTYKGQKSDIEAYAYTLNGVEWSISNVGPVYTLSVNQVTDPDNNEPDPIVSWELQSNGMEKSIFDSDNTFIKSLHPTHVQQLKEATKNPPKSGALPAFSAGTGITSTQLKNAHIAWHLYLLGVKSVPSNLPILKRQMTVSNQYIIANSLANIERIYSTNTLINEENIPNTITECLPNPSPSEIASTISPSIKLLYGWKKTYPTITRVAEFKYQVSQVWHYGLWSKDLYDILL